MFVKGPLRAALVFVTCVGALFTPSKILAASVDAISFSADPTEDEPISVTVTGTTEANRTLFASVRSGATTCAAVAIDDWSTIGGFAQRLSGTQTGDSGDAIAAGSFSKTYQFTPTTPGPYRVCAYVARTSYTNPLSVQRNPVDVRPPSASAAISGVISPYLTGQTATLIATGVVEHSSSFASVVSKGDEDCSVDRIQYDSRRTLVAGPFSVPIDVTYGPQSAHTICLFVFNGNDFTPLVVSRHMALKLSLGRPVLREQTAVTGRRPTLTWKTRQSGTDMVVLLEAGSPILNITEAGALDPSLDAAEVVVENADSYLSGGRDQSTGPTPDPSLARVEHRADGSSVVVIKTPLPPGKYSWRVVRTRDLGEMETSPTVPFQINGPPLTRLEVSSKSTRGQTSKRPGYTRGCPVARRTLG